MEIKARHSKHLPLMLWLVFLLTAGGVAASFIRVWTCPECVGEQLVVSAPQVSESFTLLPEQLVSCDYCEDRRKVTLGKKLWWWLQNPSSTATAQQGQPILGAGAIKALASRMAKQSKESIAKTEATSEVIRKVCGAIERYKFDHGKYPMSFSELAPGSSVIDAKDRPRGAYLDQFPKDAWNNYLIYRVPGKNGRPYDVGSFGADGVEGGVGDDRDIWGK